MRTIPRISAIIVLALCGMTVLRADPRSDFLDLVVKQAHSGNQDALKWETFGRKFDPELTNVQTGELVMLFSGYVVTQRTVTAFAHWKPEFAEMAFNGRPTAYVETPDAVAQFQIRSLAVGTNGQTSVGTVVIPIIFRDGKFWIVATRYKDQVAAAARSSPTP